MSFIITVFVPEGIVMSSDSRGKLYIKENNTAGEQWYYFDSFKKLHIISQDIIVGFYGDSIFNNKSIYTHIYNIKNEVLVNNISVIDFPELLQHYFADNLGSNHVFYVAGYGLNAKNLLEPYVFIVDIPQKITKRLNYNSGEILYNYHCGGDTEYINRLIGEVKLKEGDEWADRLNCNINLDFYSLEESISFTEYFTKISIETPKYLQINSSIGGFVNTLIAEPHRAWIYK